MARVEKFSAAGEERFIVKNNLDDVLDLDRFGETKYGRKIVSWKKEFGIRDERLCKQKAKEVMKRMLQLLATDLIENHNYFVLPKQDTGFMKLGDLSKRTGATKHQAHPVTGKAVHGGIIVLDRLVTGHNGGRRYLFKMVQPLIRRMITLQENGHTW